MDRFKVLFDKESIRKSLKTNSFVIFMLLGCFPIGLILLWKSKNFRKNVKILVSIVGLFWFSLFFTYAFRSAEYETKYNDLKETYADLDSEKSALDSENERLELIEEEFTAYKEKMTPYESLSEADAKKRKNDGKLAQKVSEEIDKLPEISSMVLGDKGQFNKVKDLYNKLTKEQKELVDNSEFTTYEEKIKELEAEAAEAKEAAKKKAEADKKKAEEEAKGYETGITYDQLARTPDDYLLKKVKFYGKVIQVMEGDDSTQIRLAVNDNYDTVLYAEYDSSSVTSRVLEDDYITISGISSGLLSYESTMGGKITIPSVLVEKIDQ